jgi:alpha-tubulin suppressor-like RCC1 family protein
MESSIASLLIERLNQSRPYTHIGPHAMVTINPRRFVPLSHVENPASVISTNIYNETVLHLYYTAFVSNELMLHKIQGSNLDSITDFAGNLSKLPPHFFQSIFEARSIAEKGKHAVIVLTGEEGSGKSFHIHQALHAIAYNPSLSVPSLEHTRRVLNRTLDALLVLEAFSSVYTSHCLDNSNAMFTIRLSISPPNGILQSQLHSFFYNLNIGILSSNSHRHDFSFFQVFLQLVAGSTDAEKRTCKLRQSFDLYGSSLLLGAPRGTVFHDSMRDKFLLLCAALGRLGLTRQSQLAIWRILSSILLLQELVFEAVLESDQKSPEAMLSAGLKEGILACQVQNKALVEDIASLLGLETHLVSVLLTHTEVRQGGNMTLIPLQVAAAKLQRDLFCALLYKRLWNSLVLHIERELSDPGTSVPAGSAVVGTVSLIASPGFRGHAGPSESTTKLDAGALLGNTLAEVIESLFWTVVAGPEANVSVTSMQEEGLIPALEVKPVTGMSQSQSQLQEAGDYLEDDSVPPPPPPPAILRKPLSNLRSVSSGSTVQASPALQRYPKSARSSSKSVSFASMLERDRSDEDEDEVLDRSPRSDHPMNSLRGRLSQAVPNSDLVELLTGCAVADFVLERDEASIRDAAVQAKASLMTCLLETARFSVQDGFNGLHTGRRDAEASLGPSLVARLRRFAKLGLLRPPSASEASMAGALRADAVCVSHSTGYVTYRIEGMLAAALSGAGCEECALACEKAGYPPSGLSFRELEAQHLGGMPVSTIVRLANSCIDPLTSLLLCSSSQYTGPLSGDPAVVEKLALVMKSQERFFGSSEVFSFPQHSCESPFSCLRHEIRAVSKLISPLHGHSDYVKYVRCLRPNDSHIGHKDFYTFFDVNAIARQLQVLRLPQVLYLASVDLPVKVPRSIFLERYRPLVSRQVLREIMTNAGAISEPGKVDPVQAVLQGLAARFGRSQLASSASSVQPIGQRKLDLLDDLVALLSLNNGAGLSPLSASTSFPQSHSLLASASTSPVTLSIPVKVGSKHVFTTAAFRDRLEGALGTMFSRFEESALIIQRRIKAWLLRRWFLWMRSAIIRFQANARRYIYSHAFQQYKAAGKALVQAMKVLHTRALFLRKVAAQTILSRAFRRFRRRNAYRSTVLFGLRAFLSLAHGKLLRHSLSSSHLAAVSIQRNTRSFLRRKQIEKTEHNSATKIQSFWRGYTCRQTFAIAVRIISARRVQVYKARFFHLVAARWRGYKCRVRYRVFRAAVILLQAHIRRRQAVFRLALMRAACIVMQAVVRGGLVRTRIRRVVAREELIRLQRVENFYLRKLSEGGSLETGVASSSSRDRDESLLSNSSAVLPFFHMNAPKSPEKISIAPVKRSTSAKAVSMPRYSSSSSSSSSASSSSYSGSLSTLSSDLCVVDVLIHSALLKDVYYTFQAPAGSNVASSRASIMQFMAPRIPSGPPSPISAAIDSLDLLDPEAEAPSSELSRIASKLLASDLLEVDAHVDAHVDRFPAPLRAASAGSSGALQPRPKTPPRPGSSSRALVSGPPVAGLGVTNVDPKKRVSIPTPSPLLTQIKLKPLHMGHVKRCWSMVWREFQTNLALSGASVSKLSLGQTFSVALTSSGSLFSWGSGAHGELGLGADVQESASPQQLAIVVGKESSLFSSGGGGGGNRTRASSFGGGSVTSIAKFSHSAGAVQLAPLAPSPVCRIRFTSLSAGSKHTLALADAGTVYAWGLNTFGECGLHHTSPVYYPTSVVALDHVVQVSAGAFHSLFLTRSGVVYTCGMESKLVPSTSTDKKEPKGRVNTRRLHSNVPTFEASLAKIPIASISAGSGFSLALSVEGGVYSWGENSLGQCGVSGVSSDSNDSYVLFPTKILSNISRMSAGHSHAIASTYDGLIFAWGLNKHGQCGASPASLPVVHEPRLIGHVINPASPSSIDLIVSAGFQESFVWTGSNMLSISSNNRQVVHLHRSLLRISHNAPDPQKDNKKQGVKQSIESSSLVTSLLQLSSIPTRNFTLEVEKSSTMTVVAFKASN